MNISAFSISNTLESKGFSKHEATYLARAIVEALDASTKDLVTKSELRLGMATCQSDMQSKMLDLEMRITTWTAIFFLGGMYALGALFLVLSLLAKGS